MKLRIIGIIIIILLLPVAIASLTMEEDRRISIIRDIYYLPNRVLYYKGVHAAKRCIHYLHEGNLVEIEKNSVKIEDLDLKIRNRFLGIDIIEDKAYLEKIFKRLREKDIDTLEVLTVGKRRVDGIDILDVEFMLRNNKKTDIRIIVWMIKQSGKWLIDGFGFPGKHMDCVIDLRELE